jgi:hypothetical protein
LQGASDINISNDNFMPRISLMLVPEIGFITQKRLDHAAIDISFALLGNTIGYYHSPVINNIEKKYWVGREPLNTHRPRQHYNLEEIPRPEYRSDSYYEGINRSYYTHKALSPAVEATIKIGNNEAKKPNASSGGGASNRSFDVPGM